MSLCAHSQPTIDNSVRIYEIKRDELAKHDWSIEGKRTENCHVPLTLSILVRSEVYIERDRKIYIYIYCIWIEKDREREREIDSARKRIWKTPLG